MGLKVNMWDRERAIQYNFGWTVEARIRLRYGLKVDIPYDTGNVTRSCRRVRIIANKFHGKVLQQDGINIQVY